MEEGGSRFMETGFDTILFVMAVVSMVMLITFAYSVLRVKNEVTQNGPSLAVSEDPEPVRYQDQTIYTGRKDFREYGIDNDLAGGEEIVSRSSGEYSVGSAVFTEIQELPTSIKEVQIGSQVYANRADKADSKIVNLGTMDYKNIAYYTKNGLIEDLFNEVGIDLTRVYKKEYDLDSKGNITTVKYLY